MPDLVTYAAFYGCVLLMAAPHGLLFWGALRRVHAHGGRVRRLQVEGTAMVLAGTLARWVVYDPIFGIGSGETAYWPWWFARAESGLFFIGLLFFVLGFFLDRRPRPGLRPWPESGKAVSFAAILLGVALGLAGYFLFRDRVPALPWGLGRILFSLGLYPFAIRYFWLGKRMPEPPEDA